MARLFFALHPRPAERLALAAALPAGATQGRIIPPDNLHITLAFLGEVGEEVADALRAMETPVLAQPFELRFDRLAYWEGARTRVLLPDAVPTAANQLQDGVQWLLKEQGLPFDRRQWLPHVTLERRAAPAPVGLVAAVTIPFDEYVLMQSETRQEGAVYTPLARWPLPRDATL